MGGGGRNLDFTEAAQDALAVLDAHGVDHAIVMGACAGASIGLELLRKAPGRVSRLVLHEPLLIKLLGDPVDLARYDDYYDLFIRTGTAAAMGVFLAHHGLPYPELFRRACVRDGEQWMRHEYFPLLHYQPDIAALREHRRRITILVGEVSAAENRTYARAAARLAEQLGTPVVPIAGHHGVYFASPQDFVNDFCRLILAR